MSVPRYTVMGEKLTLIINTIVVQKMLKFRDNLVRFEAPCGGTSAVNRQQGAS